MLVIEGEKPFKLSIWDFSGDPFYLNTIYHFLDPNALYLLTFNLSTYRTGDFQKTFGSWLNYIIAKNNEVSSSGSNVIIYIVIVSSFLLHN